MQDSATYPSTSRKVSEATSLLSNHVLSSRHRHQWPQHLASILASLIALATGCVAGWSSPAIPYLQGNLGFLQETPISDSEASWVGSVVTLGALLGAIPAGKLAGIFGRKWFLLSLAFPLIGGWLIIVLCYQNVFYIYLGRFICGLTFGAVTVAVPMYNNEIAEDSVRGVLGIYFDLMWCVGILWAYVVGAYTSFYWLTLSSCLMPVLFMCSFVFMPESPVHLMVNNDEKAAERSLRWLRTGRTDQYDVGDELHKIKQLVEESNIRSKAPSVKITDFKSLRLKAKNFFGSTAAKAVGIGLGLMTFQRMSGVSAIVYYTVDIFRGAGTKIPPEIATIVVGIVSVVASAASALFVDRLGRRFLLILSGSVMAMSLSVMAGYFIVKNQGYSTVNLNWIPVVAICIYLIFFGIGFGPIPWFMLAEILPEEIIEWSTSLIVCYTWFLTFIITKNFNSVVERVGYSTTYASFALICASSVYFVQHYVPETKNKSKIEIHDEISKPFSATYHKNYGTTGTDYVKI